MRTRTSVHMRKSKKLIFNTLLLTVSSFIMQTVAVSFNVYLTNKIGSAGIGLFQLTMSVYSMAITFACGGIRLASTRLTVNTLSGDCQTARKTIKLCIKYGLCTGTGIAIILFLFSTQISGSWLGDLRAASSLKILSACLPFVAMSAAINGYYTAVRTIYKYAVIQAVEQAVKIAVVIFVLNRVAARGLEYACIAIVFGMCMSEIFSYSCSFVLCFRSKTAKRLPCRENSSLKELVRIALPDAVGAGARSVLLTIEHLLIPKGFQKAGSSAAQAMSIYGVIHGMVFPILLYPSAILTSLSGLLIPEIAECSVRGQKQQVARIIENVISLTLMYSVGVAGVMYTFADIFSVAIYKTPDAAQYIQLLSPLIPIMYLDMGVDGMLKGLDQQVYSMRVNIMDSAICVVLVYFLLPRYAVKGYIFILFASEIINFYMSMRRLMVITESDFLRLGLFIKSIVCILFALVILSAGKQFFGVADAATKPFLTVNIILFAVIYFVAMYIIGGIKSSDIKRVRGLLS